MAAAIIFVSCAIVLIVYFAFSIRVGNYVNILTPILFFQVPVYFALEPVHLYLFGDSGTVFAYLYCYATYTLQIVAMAVGYLVVSDRVLPILPKIPKLKLPGMPYLMLTLAALLYAPILIEYSRFLTNPRQIYTLTRTGYGTEFFLSSFAVYLALIMLLFSGTRRRGLKALFVIVAIVLLGLHGSKGQVLNFLLIGLYFAVFVRQARFSFARMAAVVSVVSAVILVLFYITFSGAVRDDLLGAIAGYSDYTRNAMLVMDDGTLPLQDGRLTLEEAAYSLVPRALFPNKPKDFGALWLAERYFPTRFEGDAGAPAFGIGVGYADFGLFSIVYYAVCWMISGMFMRVLVARLRARPDAGTFVLLLVMLEVPLIPAGAAVPLLAYYLCAVGVRCVSRESVRYQGYVGAAIGPDDLTP